MSNESLVDKERRTNPIEIEKLLDVKIQTMEKGANIDPIKITILNEENPFDVGVSSDIEVHIMEIPSISTNTMLRIDKVTQVCKEDILPKVKQESTTNMESIADVTRMPYRHPNKKN